ncbi:MAG: cation diffusion facilitator family transporter [Proteobacteria bacterium]|nr:cation diffusion facilitator family transporter [Pseudomonadota bacterium]
MRFTTYAAVIVALFLAAIKLFGWFETGSVALLSSLIDSVLDALASIINLIAVRTSLLPHDREHRFGHGKAEPLAGLVQAVIIGASVIFVLVEAVPRFFDPVSIAHGETGVGVMVISIVLTGGLVALQRYAIRRTGSVAITADSLHYRGDLLMNIGVIAALLLATYGNLPVFDPLLAVLVVGYVLYSVWSIIRQSFDMLMDREFPEAERARIRTIVQSHPEVLAVHDMRTRQAGIHSFVQLHIELPAEMSLKRAHVISDEVEADIRRMFPETDVIIHQDPEGVDEERAEFV